MARRDEQADSRFNYFLVQTHVLPQGGDDLGRTVISLTVEDLSSGEKRVFGSVSDFSRFLSRLAEPDGDERWAPPAR